MSIDGTLIASFDFGNMHGTHFEKLSGTFVPSMSGMFTLLIENTRSLASSTQLYNYIDNITIAPQVADLEIDKINIPYSTGTEVAFTIRPGVAHKNKDYWLWMSVSGTYPGIPVSGLVVPLNRDILFDLGLMYPNLPGTTGFLGKLSMFGLADATFDLPPNPDMSLVGIPIYFAYVLTSPGPKLPLTYASTPVHIKYVP